MMKRCLPLLVGLLLCPVAMASIPSGYYNNAIGKSDEALMSALEGIIYSHTQLTYAYLWTAFNYTDVGDDGYYIDMYSNCKYNSSADHTSGASYVGQGINREHSFPKSWWNSNQTTSLLEYTDLTHLIPTDAYVNQRRSNYAYGVCSSGETYTNGDYTMLGKIGTSTYSGYTGTVYEPDDEYKGDLARIYFYMVTCYKSDVSTWSCDMIDYSTNGYKAFSSWVITMLMEWHRADPVSTKEINRNEGVYGQQGNRNPFVDHPELAEYIWGTKQGRTWTGEDDDEPTITKETPLLYPADTTAVTSSSFRADWKGVDNVSSYTLYVNQVETSDTVVLLNETFSGVTATSDGSSDISSSLDSYADNSGWTGYKVYEASGGLKLGTSSAAGYLVSPTLDMGSVVSVTLNAASWVSSKSVSDGASAIISCGSVADTVALTTSAADYTVVLTGCTDSNIKISCTAGKKRMYVYGVKVYEGDLNLARARRRVIVEEGDSSTRTISGITDTCYTVSALHEGGTFEYKVKAVYTDGTTGDWSNIEYVTLAEATASGKVGDINCDGEVNVGDVTTLIDYLLGNDPSPIDLDAADVNKDNEINAADVSALIDILLGSGVTYIDLMGSGDPMIEAVLEDKSLRTAD